MDFLSVAGAARAGKTGMKTVRIARMLRVMRLMRLARMPQLFKKTVESVNSEALEIVFEIIKIMFVFVGFAHLIACLWYGIGSQDWTDHNWVQYYDLTDAEMGYQYSTSLHWSLTQFIGSMEVQPRNIIERIYAVFVLVFAFIWTAAFVSSITSMMTRLYIIAGRQVSQQAVLRKFLHRKGVSRQLALRIQRNAQYAMKEQQRNTPEEQIEVLNLVSDPLRMELHFELYAPSLLQHKFFNRYHEENPTAVRRVCHGAISHKYCSHGDVIFSEGEVPTDAHMFCVLRGLLLYSTEDDGVHGQLAHKVGVGTYVCEPTLWAQSWFHHGTLRACAECRLMVLDAKAFQDIACQLDNSFQVKRYAMAFIEALNKPDSICSDLVNRELAEELLTEAYQDEYLTAEQEQARRNAFSQSQSTSRAKSWRPDTTLTTARKKFQDLRQSCRCCCRRLRDSVKVNVLDADEPHSAVQFADLTSVESGSRYS